MKKYVRNKLKLLYYKVMRMVARTFVPKHYRDEYDFFEGLKGNTYNDLSYMEKRLRNTGHVLDKTLVFSTFKKKPVSRKSLITLLGEVKAIPGHDVETVQWCEKVLQEYERLHEGMQPLNRPKDILDTKSVDILGNIIKSRRSIRSFRPDKISKENLYMILESGLWAPSGCNRQNIEYLILEDMEDVHYCQKLAGEGYSFPGEASLNIIVLIDPRGYAIPSQRHMAYLEGGAATQNMLLMAHSLGVGSCWLFWAHTGKKHMEFSKKYSLSPWLLPVAMICFGYPDKAPMFAPARKDMMKCVHYSKGN